MNMSIPSPKKNIPPSENDFPWDEIKELLKCSPHKEMFEKTKKSIYAFAVKESNRPQVIKSARAYLQKTDPKNMTQEKVESMADMMQLFARMVLKEIDVIKGSK